MDSKKAGYIYIILLLPLIYFAIFLHLDSLPFRVWDEAYLATHTYEMMHDQDYIVTHSFGEPEMSNTKPPLVIWLMTASCKLFGFNEISIRLPNALAGVLTSFIIFFFSSHVLKSPFKGFLSVIVLICSSGFIRLHVIRTGEYDAFLVLFVTIYSLCYFMILEQTGSRNKTKLWVIFTIAFVCAILSKGVAALLIAPGLLLYTVVSKQLSFLLKSKELYISGSLIIFFGAGYYLLREYYNPGYIKAVYENELGGRYLNEMIKTSPWTYLDEVFNKQFKAWIPFAIIGIMGIVKAPKDPSRKLLGYCTIVVVTLITVLSVSSTRLNWYDAPAFPFLALLAGSGIYMVFDYTFSISHSTPSLIEKSVIAMFIVICAYTAYSDIITSNLSASEDLWDTNSYNLTHYIEKRQREGGKIIGYKVVVDWYMMRALFCQVKKWEQRNQNMEIINDVKSLKVGDRVITNQDPMKQEIRLLYTCEQIDSYHNVEAFKILGKRPL